MVHLAGDGHPGPAMSAADIVAALYFKVLRIGPVNPGWPERDRCILSKGHALRRRGRRGSRRRTPSVFSKSG